MGMGGFRPGSGRKPKLEAIPANTRHGHLTVVRELEREKGHRRYECKCDCGKLVMLRHSHFYATRLHCSQQCSYLRTIRVNDLTGKRFGRWTVLSLAGSARQSKWNVRCDCGNEGVRPGPALTFGHTQSCGCSQNSTRTPDEQLAARRQNSRTSARKHAARVKAAKIKYETKRTHATPPWLTKEHWAAMDRIYAKARHMTRTMGILYAVDHKHPINGKTISGLHVPWNLQILPQAENARKSNRYAGLSGD